MVCRVKTLILSVLCCGWASFATAAPPQGAAPLVRFYNHQLNEHVYSLQSGEQTEWRKDPRFKEHLAIGLVSTQLVPGTVPFQRAIRKSDARHFYAIATPSTSPDSGGPTEFLIDDTNFQAFVWTEPGDGRIPIYANTWPDKTDTFLDPDQSQIDKLTADTLAKLKVKRLGTTPNPLFYLYPASLSSVSVQAVAQERFLDDLRESGSSSSYGTLGINGSTGFPDFDVQRVRLKSAPQPLTHSLSFTPFGTTSGASQQRVAYVSYNLKGAYMTFSGTVALNFPTMADGMNHAKAEGWNGQSGSPITFRVVGDRRVLWESLPMQAHGEFQEYEIDIAGINQLRLEVTCSGSERFGWSFWGNPRLTTMPGSQNDALMLEETASVSPASRSAGVPARVLADTIEDAERSVVRIEAESDRGQVLGSGFLVQPGLIMTNAHVLAGATSARVVFPDDQIFRVEGSLLVDADRDIAIVKLSSPAALDLPVLPLSLTVPRKGEQVVALGSPLGLSFTATSGVVSAVRSGEEIAQESGKRRAGTWIQIDAALSSGNSGGPIINDAGAVVAMSTLASISGQNLNFGISSADMLLALESAGTRQLSQLSSIKGNAPRTAPRQSPGQAGSIGRVEIPQEAFTEYVTRGRDEFETIKQDLSRELQRVRSTMRDMRGGESLIPNQLARAGIDVVRNIKPKKKSDTTWYFRSESIKNSIIADMDKRAKELANLSTQLADGLSPTALLSVLSEYGPRVDTRSNHSIGFLNGAIILKVLNGQDLLVAYNDMPYLVSRETTVGLWSGHELPQLPVFVNGTLTGEGLDGSSTTLTLLQSVSTDEIKTALATLSDQEKVDNELRTWRDRSGKFAIEATLDRVEKQNVMLRKKDGSTLSVPVSKLSEEDQKFLAERK